MRIRTQILLALPPLFLTLGAATGGLAYMAAREELLRDLEEEVTALAVATAEFLAAPDASLDDAGPALDRLIEFGQARRVVVYNAAGTPLAVAEADRDGGGLAPTLAAALALPPPEEGAGRVREVLTADAEVVDSIVQAAEGVSHVTAWAPIRPQGRPSVGAVAVTTDASRVAVQAATVLGRFALMAGAMALLGILVSVALAAFLSRRVGALERAASEVAAGAYGRETRVGGVQEVSDLANTLNTMSSVLDDLLRRGRKALVTGRGASDDGALAAAYREAAGERAEEPAELGGVRVVARRLGPGEPGDLSGWVARDGGGGAAWAGRLRAKGGLDAAVDASAMERLLAARLARSEGRTVAAELSRLFPIESLEIAEWNGAPSAAGGVRVTRVGASGVADAEPTPAGAPVVLQTFAGDDRAVVRAWTELFRDLSLEELAGELSLALGSALSGRVTLLAPRSTRSERQPLQGDA